MNKEVRTFLTVFLSCFLLMLVLVRKKDSCVESIDKKQIKNDTVVTKVSHIIKK